MASQFSLVGGVRSGAGAMATGVGADQTGNLLGIDGIVMTPRVMINTHNNPGGVKKKRFGVVSSKGGFEFEYPSYPVKGEGNGQAYKATKAGYLPGNGGGGNAGFGIDREWHEPGVSEDLLMAKSIAQKEAGLFAKFSGGEHVRTVDRTTETLKQHFEEQSAEHEREKISHLMAMGFSEEEIARKAMKDREKAIETAGKMAPKISSKVEGILNTRTSDKFFNDDVAPGLVPARKDMSSYERAISAGTPVAQAKAKQAMRMKEKMGLRVDRHEKVQARVPLSQSQIFQTMLAVASRDKKELEELPIKHEEELIKHQKMKDDLVNQKLLKMKQAMVRE